MKIDGQWIRHNFKDINRRHFKGILKQPKFAVDTLTNSYGSYEWEYDNEGKVNHLNDNDIGQFRAIRKTVP